MIRLSLEVLESRELLASGIPTTWTQRGAGGGGALFSPSISPLNSGEVYVSSDMSQLFQTTNTGASWNIINHHQFHGGHQSKVGFTNDSNIRYGVDYTDPGGGGLRFPTKTTDGGVTWTRLSSDPTGGEVYHLSVDPNSTQRLLVSSYNNLYFSGNGGASWTNVYASSDLHVGGVFWDGNNIYAGTSKGLLVSTNGLSSSFTLSSATGIAAGQAILGFSGAKSGGVTRFFAVTKDSTTVYAGTQAWDYGDGGSQSIYVMDQGAGSSWNLRMNGINSTNVEAWWVGTAANNINVAYVSGGSSDGLPTVYKTTDGGLNWSNSFLTTNNQNIFTGWQGHLGDRQYSYGEVALGFTVSSSDPNVAVMTDYGFAHVTTDGGVTWKQMYVNPADQNPTGAATPKGRSYRGSGLENTTGHQIFWADANTMMIGNSDVRMQRSTNAGLNWGYGYTGNTYNSNYRLVMHPTTGVMYSAGSSVHDLYQSTYLTDSRIDGGTGAVLFSTDKGATWQTMQNFGRVVSWVALDPTNANRMYASVVNSTGSGTAGGIYVSNNINLGAAATWTKLTNPPRTEGHPFNIVVLNDGSIVATYSGRRAGGSLAFTASSGVFHSTNGGLSWTDRSHSGMQYWTKDIVIDPHDATQNTWYAGVWSGWGGPPNGLGGLYRSTNRGVSWTRLTSGLDRVTSITINPTDQNEAWVTTETQGLWYSPNIRAATPIFQDVQGFAFRQPERVFYNPNNTNEMWIATFGGGVWKGNLPTTGTIRLASSGYSVNENDGTVTITVQRVDGSSGAASVNYTTVNGSALSGSDYITTSGTLNWADGDTSPKLIHVPIVDNSTTESTESFTLQLSSANGSSLGSPATATITIQDDDSEEPHFGEIRFRSATYQVTEAGPSILLEVERVNGLDGMVSVDFASLSGTATSGSDFTSTSGTLTWQPGDAGIYSITVPILEDTLYEGNETFNVTLGNVVGGAVLTSPTTATVTIQDNDSRPSSPLQRIIASPSDGYAPLVKVIDGVTGQTIYSFLAYSATYKGGVRTATADFNKDGVPDIVTAPGLGASKTDAGRVKVFDGRTGTPLAGVWSNGIKVNDSASGLFVATGDFNNDGTPDVVTGNDAGGLPIVHIIDGATGKYFPGSFGTFYGQSSYLRSGVRVATGDVNGDGKLDIITSPGVGGTNINVYSLTGRTPALIKSWRPFDRNTSGLFVAAGDLDGDGKAELIAGNSSGGQVKVLDGTNQARTFKPLTSHNGAVRVAVGDVNGDGKLDIITSLALSSSIKVKLYDAKTLSEFFTQAGELTPFTK